jgi:hypothetical protein
MEDSRLEFSLEDLATRDALKSVFSTIESRVRAEAAKVSAL